jgi:L-amino acid N-acyltransferase YncA
MQSLLKKLLQQQKYFVEEIDRMLCAPEKIKLFPKNLKNTGEASWIYMAGDSDSADWNLARCINDPEIAQEYLHLLPKNETQLLINKTDEPNFVKQIKRGEIFWFESSRNLESVLHNYKNKLKNQNWFNNSEIRPRKNVVSIKKCKRLNLELYLFNKNTMLGFIKTIRETPDFVEVYIEIRPDFQGKGAGTFLLLQMINLVQNNDKNLVYSVEADNLASIRIAQKANLSRFNTLSRFAI